MDYTLSPQHVVHPGTGNRMHDVNQAIPTQVTDKDLNQLTWSLMKILSAAGVAGQQFAPNDPASYDRLLVAMATLMRRSYGSVAVAAGAADAITATFDPPVIGLVDGLNVHVRAIAENATSAPTFKADGTTAKVICKEDGLPLSPADIAGSGHRLQLQYDQESDKWVLLNPSFIANFGAHLHASNGYQRFPGGLLLQWIEGAPVTAEGYQNLIWPTAFSSACFKAFASTGGTDSGADAFFQVVSYNTTQVQVVANNTGVSGMSARWPIVFGIGV